jgi:cytochrome c553
MRPNTLVLLRAHRYLTWALFFCVGIVLCPLSTAWADNRTGEQIYRQRCAKCHGASGEGTDDNYPNRLVGNKSVDQLARFIAKKMPKDSPQKCEGEDAQKVSAYIYDSFYSNAAQERNKPPRIELARLTVRQYRNAIADLIGSFRSSTPSPNAGTPPNGQKSMNESGQEGQHGLRGEYFKSFGFRPRNRALERVDPLVQFDFGVSAPDSKNLEPDRFSIRWNGGVTAPETGTYEFIVRTGHAARLWLNDIKTPLIDAWVQSGGSGDTQHSASIFLLGGRSYPVRLEFAKGKQGEKDGKKDEAKPPPVKAAIALEWKLQQQAAQVIPTRNLSPSLTSELFVVGTPFPPDDRSVGYERGTSISKAWDQATTDAAIEVANYVVAHLPELAGVGEKAADREPRLREFCARFADRAFRRPLSDEQKKVFIARRFEGSPDLETAVKRVVLMVLKSPQFLYQEVGSDALAGASSREDVKARGYEVASRLSFGLWDSLPDRELLEAAAAGRLVTPEQVTRQAERMLPDSRTRAKIRDFLLEWLKVNPAPEISKPTELYPDFNKEMASDLRTSLELFLDDVVWSESSDWRQLFLADYLYLNGRLAKFYGANLPTDAAFTKVSQPSRSCAGILSHPYLMATFAYTATTSPIHRGVFLSRNVLGVPLRPPPEAFTPLAAELHPELTTRERVALQTKPQQCQTCHEVINPLGFTLENFDAVGRYRDQEKGRPIDATGAFETRSGEQVKFVGVRDLATFLSGSQDAQNAFIERLFHCLVKQPVRAFGPRMPTELRNIFEKNHYSIRKLIVEMMVIEEKGYEAK